MKPTTLKIRHKFLPVLGAAVLIVLTFSISAAAKENVYKAPSCKLYKGDASLESLQKRETDLKEKLLRSASGAIGDFCELANIHYKLARLAPDKQVQYLNSCIDYSERAILRDGRAGIAYFFKGLCLGRQGEMRGIWGSLKIIEPFRKNMETAVKINPAIDRGGPHRALGRLYFELPMILGGDIKQSIDHLLKAVVYGPMYWENHFFLAESYFKNSQYLQARTELERAMEMESRLDNDPDKKTHKVEFQGLMKAIENNIY